ncbi:MAG: SDR family oxidoreductase [Armatimonadetes bacterium]|nr:SDR family oxidoreductase [Armatimonadota bacterium]
MLSLFSSAPDQAPVSLVTGASRGIGAAIAMALARAGSDVAINHLDDDANAESVVSSIQQLGRRSMHVNADVALSERVEALVSRTLQSFGRIDILICNAGICPFADFMDIEEAQWDRVLAVNLKGVFLTSQAVARHMTARQGGGRIVATGSISSLVGGSKQAHYCASKAGENLLIKSMALSLAPHGITCNAVLPGTVETDINRSALADPALRAHLEEGTPLGRLGQPVDVTSAVLWLASKEAAWTTGSLVVVDGGATSTLQ